MSKNKPHPPKRNLQPLGNKTPEPKYKKSKALPKKNLKRPPQEPEKVPRKTIKKSELGSLNFKVMDKSLPTIVEEPVAVKKNFSNEGKDVKKIKD